MFKEEITSVGWLHNHDGTIALILCNRGWHVFVTISRQEFDEAGGREGLNKNKQIALDFLNKYGVGRPD